MTIRKSTIDHNQATAGGGVDHRGGSLQITNTTISGNNATDNGGGIHNAFGVYLTNVTLVDNAADGNGGGIFNNEANAYPINTIIAMNQALDGNCASSEFANMVSQGHNIDDDNTCNLSAVGDIPGTDPLLGPLQDNGGMTATHALLEGSPAINQADDNDCPSTDQRNVSRPQGLGCDIGAYELIFGGEANLGLTKIDALDPVTLGDNITYTLSIDNGGPDDAQNVVLTDNLPGSVIFVSAIPDQGSCEEAGGVVTCNLGDVLNGSSTSVEIAVTTTQAGILTNYADLSADTTDLYPDDNHDSEPTVVEMLLSVKAYLPVIMK
jgi:uncharacterized repeat protein (TIGR01451 family)